VNRWTSILLGAAAVSLPLGWVLVFVSGYSGDASQGSNRVPPPAPTGSEIVWRIGGLMIYAAFVILLVAAVIGVARLVAASVRRRRPAHS
jgi:heme/copper-type cytochrome/quinol oxidase subunit 2